MPNKKDTSQTSSLLQRVITALTPSGGGGLATEATLTALLNKNTTIQIDTAQIDLNTDGLEGLATAGNGLLTTIAGDTTSLDAKTPALGTALIVASTPVNIASDQVVPVSATALPLPTGAATSANQLPDGHNVTIDNADGAAAVNIQDGGNSITIDNANLDAAISTLLKPADTLAAVTTVSAVTAITNALPAGENHLGSIGGNTVKSSSNVVLSVAGSYATGDYVGTTTTPQAFPAVTRTNGGTSIIKSIFIQDKVTGPAVDMELWVFNATFTAPTDNAAWSISDGDLASCCGVIPLPASKWYSSALNKVYTDDSLNLVFKAAGGDNQMFYALVARGTTPTWASLDLNINIGLLQD